MTKHELDDAHFADMVKCDRSTISRIRRNLHKPSRKLMRRILLATDEQVTPNDFYGVAA